MMASPRMALAVLWSWSRSAGRQRCGHGCGGEEHKRVYEAADPTAKTKSNSPDTRTTSPTARTIVTETGQQGRDTATFLARFAPAGGHLHITEKMLIGGVPRRTHRA